jgi:hypothetical protein
MMRLGLLPVVQVVPSDREPLAARVNLRGRLVNEISAWNWVYSVSRGLLKQCAEFRLVAICRTFAPGYGKVMSGPSLRLGC